MSTHKSSLGMSEPLFEYVLAHTRDDALLRRLREETLSTGRARMQISPDQGQFMAFLVKALGVRKALEVGVFTGYSSTCTARALPEDGTLVACDISEEWTSIARRYWEEAGVASKIDLRIAPALVTLDALIAEEGQAGTFDFAFVDADKANMPNYVDRIHKLLRVGGVLLLDNVLWGGLVLDPRHTDEDTVAIRELNDALYTDERFDMSMVGIADGITLLRKR